LHHAIRAPGSNVQNTTARLHSGNAPFGALGLAVAQPALALLLTSALAST